MAWADILRKDPAFKQAARPARKLSTVTKNIIANYAGRAWTGLISLVFVPLYIKFLGIEAYGLIGIYLSLVALLSVLDMGLSATLSRELARLSASPDTEREARNLVRTMELVYWGIGIAIGAGIYLLASPIARYWVNVQPSSVSTVEEAVTIMGFVAALEWPVALYAGGLMGLQRQVSLNAVRAGMATVQSGGAVLILWLVSPTITAYFKWQILVSAAQTLFLGICLWSALPAGAGEKSAFRRELLLKNWKFAAGMTGISVLVTVLTQLDKVILSRLLTLEMFGYYVLAFSVAGALTHIVNPIFSALFPRFSQLVAEMKEAELSVLYHKGCRLLSAIVVPVAITLALFSKEILTIWMGDSMTANHTHALLSLILIGTTLNSVMTLPYTLQLAYGWTNLSFWKNLVAVALLVPSLIWMTARYGGTGAAVVWILLNAGYFLVEIPLMHSRLLKKEMWRWYFVDVGLPLAGAACIGMLSRIAMPENSSDQVALYWILSTVATMFLLSAASLPDAREWIRRYVSK